MANKNTQKIYEISFHLIPTMDEEGVLKVFEQIKKSITKEGEIINDENPVRQNLTYTIHHTVRQSDGSHNNYDEAYFGSVKFRASREYVRELHQDIQGNEEVLRFLILETAEEDTRIGEVLPGTEENVSEEETKEKNSDEIKKPGESDKTDSDKK